MSEPFVLAIDPLPAQTSIPAATTSPAPTTAPIVVPPPNGTGGTAATTTAAGQTTTSTAPAQVATGELHNFAPMWVAVLGPINDAVGPPTEQRLERLATEFNVPVKDIGAFTNRDTVARRSDQQPVLLNTAPKPNARFAYVVRQDEIAATAVCAGHSGCQVLELTGAARDAGQAKVLMLEPLPSGETLADVDERLEKLRADYDPQRVYAVAGKEYPAFGSNGVLIFVTEFADAAEIQAFCNAKAIAKCDVRTLG
jgi:hypothetical protein